MSKWTIYARLTVAENITTARKKKRMTQSNAARLLGWTQPTLSRFEGGLTQITIDELVHIAEKYGVDFSELVFIESPHDPN